MRLFRSNRISQAGMTMLELIVATGILIVLASAAIPVALIQKAGLPLTGTSANRTGEKECSTAQEVQQCFGERLPLILDGGASAATQPSTVLSLRQDSWEFLREGAIPAEEIAALLRRDQ